MTEMTPVEIRDLIAEAREWESDPASWGDNGLVTRLADALAALTTPQEGDARERLHAKCNCVPNLGPAHCHLCGNELGSPVPWLECSAVRAVAPEPEWEYARQNRYGHVCEPDDSREQAEYRASLGGGYDTVVRRPLVWWEPLPVGGDDAAS